MNHFYVYVYFDPRTPGRFNYDLNYTFLYKPIYVGKGQYDRMYYHLTRDDNHPFVNTIQCIRNEIGIDPYYCIIDDCLSEDQAYEVEKTIIRKIGRVGTGTGSLMNLTDGGETPYRLSRDNVLDFSHPRSTDSYVLISPNNELSYIPRGHFNLTMEKLNLSWKGLKNCSWDLANTSTFRRVKRGNSKGWSCINVTDKEFLFLGEENQKLSAILSKYLKTVHNLDLDYELSKENIITCGPAAHEYHRKAMKNSNPMHTEEGVKNLVTTQTNTSARRYGFFDDLDAFIKLNFLNSQGYTIGKLMSIYNCSPNYLRARLLTDSMFHPRYTEWMKLDILQQV